MKTKTQQALSNALDTLTNMITTDLSLRETLHARDMVRDAVIYAESETSVVSTWPAMFQVKERESTGDFGMYRVQYFIQGKVFTSKIRAIKEVRFLFPEKSLLESKLFVEALPAITIG